MSNSDLNEPKKEKEGYEDFSSSNESIVDGVPKVYETTTEPLTSTTYVPKGPLSDELQGPRPVKGNQKVLLVLYAMLLVLKLVETVDLLFLIGILLTRVHIRAGYVFVAVVTCGINIGITIVGWATINCISFVAIELIISLCFLNLIIQLLSSRLNENESINGWIFVTAGLLIVSLLILKNIRKRNEKFANWIGEIQRELTFPRLKLVQQNQPVPSVIVTNHESVRV